MAGRTDHRTKLGPSGPTIVEVSGRKFRIPFECPCCGAVPDTEIRVAYTRKSGKRVGTEVTRAYEFPYCRRCAAHAARWDSAGVASAGVMLVGIVAAVAVGIVTRATIGVVIVASAIPVAWLLARTRRTRASAERGPSCGSSGCAVAHLGWTGTANVFSFASPTYTARFAEHNVSRLGEVTAKLRRLLEGYRTARLAVPTPVVPAATVPPPLTLRDWIARIEGSPGRVARRNAVERALDGIRDPAERRQLLVAATRVELAAVLEEVDGLSTDLAKARALHRAIADIQTDNIPDELQAAELAELEARSRALG